MVPTDGEAPSATGALHVAYLVSRFPKLSETFVLYEYLALRAAAAGELEMSLYGLKEEREPVRHREATELLSSVVFRSPLHIRTWRQALLTVCKSPLRVLRTLAGLCWHNRASPRFLITSLAAFPSALALARDMTHNNVQHVHAHFANVATTVAFVIREVAGIPFSFTAHGSDLHRDQTMLAQKISAATRAVTVSEYNAVVLRTHSTTELHSKIQVIHCGADLDTFFPDLTNASNRADLRSPARVRLGCVGSLLPVKGQRFLLQALALLQDKGRQIECCLIGDGPEREALERQARDSGLDIEFTGALPRAEVALRLREFDIAVVPSVPTSDGRKEGIPVALMEAMASGAAVVASQLTGIPELVKHGQTGLLVPPGDAEQLALAIARLCDDPVLRRECVRLGQEHIGQQFSLQHNARELRGVFTESFAPSMRAAMTEAGP